jgi:hypothetical protein
MATYVENITTQTTPAEHLQRDVSWALSHLEPDRTPLDTLLRRAPKGRAAISTTIEWAEDDVYPRTDTVTADSAQGAAAGQVVLHVANSANWRKNDTIILPQDKTAPMLLVESVGSGTITLRALETITSTNTTGYGTVPAIANNTTIAWTGSTLHEGGYMTGARAIMPSYSSNYEELMDHVVKYSKTREVVKNYTNEQDVPRTREQQLAEFRRSTEYKLWFQKASRTLDATSNEYRWTMNGITQYMTTVLEYNRSVVGAPTITESMLIDWLVQVWGGTNGSETRFLFADTYLLGELLKVDLLNLRVRQPVTVLGVKMERVEFNFGTLYVKHHRGFNEMGKNHYGCIVDMEWINKRDLRPMKKIPLMLEQTGYDLEAEQWKEQSSIEVKHSNCHAEIVGR